MVNEFSPWTTDSLVIICSSGLDHVPSLLRSPNCAPQLQPPRSTPTLVATSSYSGVTELPAATFFGTHKSLACTSTPGSEMFDL